MILDSSAAKEIIYVVFGITMALYYYVLLEKWPHIARFSTAVKDRKSAKIMVLSWPLLAAIFFLTLMAMARYFSSIPNGIEDMQSLVFYLACLLSFMLIPKFSAGFIRGINIITLPDDFHKSSKDAYKKDRTLESVYLSKEHIDIHGFLKDRKSTFMYGIRKTIGNGLFLLACLLVPSIGLNWLLFLPLGFLGVAIVLPKIK